MNFVKLIQPNLNRDFKSVISIFHLGVSDSDSKSFNLNDIVIDFVSNSSFSDFHVLVLIPVCRISKEN